MSYLVNLVMEGKPVVVVGAGRVAGRKVEGLLAAGARVTVVAPRAGPEIQALTEAGRIRVLRKLYAKGDLEGALLAVAATDDEAVNAAVSEDAQALGVLINVVDKPALCTFTLPAVVRRGELTLAVATEGRCPSLARAIREELEARYGPEYGEALALLGRMRAELSAKGWESSRIQRAVAELYRGGIVSLIAAGNRESVRELLARYAV
jgi:precorrin-2 dehydrogenase/sirohydrochlorin ferrochelatase